MNEIEKLRLFAAVRVPEEHRRRIDHSTRALREALPRARWVSLENQHVTLKFLGWTPSDRLGALAEVFEIAAAGRARSECSIAQLGAFPRARRARVLWVGLDDPAALLSGLATDLEASLEPLGYRREERPFTPHLTLARFKVPQRVEHLLPQLPDDLPPFPVDRLELFRSRLHPTGARYEPIACYELG